MHGFYWTTLHKPTDANPDGKVCLTVSKLRKESEKRILIVKSDYGFYEMFIVCIIFIHIFVFSQPLRAQIKMSSTLTVLPFFSTYAHERNTDEENNGYIVFKSARKRVVGAWEGGGAKLSPPSSHFYLSLKKPVLKWKSQRIKIHKLSCT